MQKDNTDPAPVTTERLSSTGRTIRVAVALLVTAALIFGTWLEDDHFPFGPFKMYVSSDPEDPFYRDRSSDSVNSPVKDTRVIGTNAEGNWLFLHQANTGFRRAEVEGQLSRFRRDPSLLSALAVAYERRRPHRPKLVQITVVVRHWEIRDRRPTGAYTDVTVAVWTVDGGRR